MTGRLEYLNKEIKKMAVCPNCGASINDGAKFCTNCGGQLPVAQPVQQPIQQPVQPAQQQYQQSVQIPNPQQQYWQQPSAQSVPVTPAEQPVPIVPAQPVYAQPITQPLQNRANRPKSNGLCNAGLALSIIGWCTMGLTAPLGLLFSFIGLIVVSKKKEPGKGKAIAGLILSGILIFGLAISLPMVWADIQKEFERGNINNPVDFLDTLDEATDKQTDHTNKYIKKIETNTWVAMEDASCLEFTKPRTFKYYQNYEDTSDNYYSGRYRIFAGQNAMDMLTGSYKNYGVKKNDVNSLISNNMAFTKENLVLVVFENDGMWMDGENVKDEEWETAYYGFVVTEPNTSMLLINMTTGTRFTFILQDDYEKIKDQIKPTTPTGSTTEADPDVATMGDSITGYVSLTQGTWDDWTEADGQSDYFDSRVGKFNRNTQTIINMSVYKQLYDSTSTKAVADALKNSMESSAKNVELKTTTLGGYSAYEISGQYQDGMYLNIWVFLDNNNKLHYISVEYFESDKVSYEMVRDTYRLG